MKKILPIALILLILFVTFAVFEELNKFDPKKKRLACQEKTTTFEKIEFENPIWETNNLIETNNFIIKSNKCIVHRKCILHIRISYNCIYNWCKIHLNAIYIES